MPRPGLAPQKSKYTKKARSRGNEVCELIYCEKNFIKEGGGDRSSHIKNCFRRVRELPKANFPHTHTPLGKDRRDALASVRDG